MSDFFDDFTTGPVEREFTHNGVTKTIHIKKLTANEKLQLDRGQAMNIAVGEGGKVNGDQRMQVDLGDFELKRQMRVWFAVCDEQGRRRFKGLNDVQSRPSDLIAALAKVVEEFHALDEGK